jgi:SAM-dependent methyltransferase
MAFEKTAAHRWKTAQSYEKQFWKSYDFEQDQKREEQLQPALKKTFTFLEQSFPLTNKRILQVGGGPNPFPWFEAGDRVNLDPLADFYKKLPSPLFKKCTNVCAQAENMPFEDNSFDLVICFNSLYHMQDPVKALCEMKRVLKKEGPFLFSITTYTSTVFPQLFARYNIGHFRGHPQAYNPNSITRLLSNAGFTLKKKIVTYDSDASSPGKRRLSRKLFNLLITQRSDTRMILQKM